MTTKNISNTSSVNIGKNIQARRKQLHLSQAALAEKCSLSVPFISLIENGHKMPALDTLILISEALGSSLDDLVHGISKDSSKEYILQTVMSILSDLAFRDQMLLLDFLRSAKSLLKEHDHTVSG